MGKPRRAAPPPGGRTNDPGRVEFKDLTSFQQQIVAESQKPGRVMPPDVKHADAFIQWVRGRK